MSGLLCLGNVVFNILNQAYEVYRVLSAGAFCLTLAIRRYFSQFHCGWMGEGAACIVHSISMGWPL